MDLWEDVSGLGAACLRGLKGKEVLLLGLCVAAQGVQAVSRAEVGTDESTRPMTMWLSKASSREKLLGR